jgi:hypothetical protein
VPFVVDVVFRDDLHADAHMPCSGKDKQQQWIAEAATKRSGSLQCCIVSIAELDDSQPREASPISKDGGEKTL